MRGLSSPSHGAQGFTLIEGLVAIAIASIMLAIGVPKMSRMMQTSKASNAVEFYKEGLTLAYNSARGNNSVSRLILTDNTVSGQYDWQVDICFLEESDCSPTSGDWSTETTIAKGDKNATGGYKSVKRTADTLMKSTLLDVKLLPSGNDTLYLRPDGWVDPNVPAQMLGLQFDPKRAGDDIRPASLKVGLMGIANRCDHTINVITAKGDSRVCPK